MRKCLLIDLEPFSPDSIDAIMFTWSELADLDVDSASPHIRIVESESQCGFSRAKTLLGPVDLNEMSSFDLSNIGDMLLSRK